MSDEEREHWLSELRRVWCPDFVHKMQPMGARAIASLEPHYAARRDLARRFKPKWLLELGVQCGHGAFAFHYGSPGLHYLGIDSYADTDGIPMDAYRQHAAALLKVEGINGSIIQANTASVERIHGEYDMVMVDGGHGFSYCYHDLELAARCSKLVLVDDYLVKWKRPRKNRYNDVTRAVQAFCQGHPDVRLETVEIPGAWSIAILHI